MIYMTNNRNTQNKLTVFYKLKCMRSIDKCV